MKMFELGIQMCVRAQLAGGEVRGSFLTATPVRD